jgi:hypothetical protein
MFLIYFFNFWSPWLMTLLLVFLSIGHSCALLSISLVLPSPISHLHFQNLGVYASISIFSLIGLPPRATHASPLSKHDTNTIGRRLLVPHLVHEINTQNSKKEVPFLMAARASAVWVVRGITILNVFVIATTLPLFLFFLSTHHLHPYLIVPARLQDSFFSSSFFFFYLFTMTSESSHLYHHLAPRSRMSHVSAWFLSSPLFPLSSCHPLLLFLLTFLFRLEAGERRRLGDGD